MFKNIIFDCFGTLIDTGTGSIEAVRSILKSVRCEVDERVFYSEWKAIKKKLMSHEPFHSEKDLFRISLEKMFERYSIIADTGEEIKPMIDTLFGVRRMFGDTAETLKKLNDMGIKYAIGSTTDTDSLMHFLEMNNLKFSNVFTSEDMKVYKPDEKFYSTILQRMKWDISESLFVGDNPVDDVAGPQSIGLKAVLLDRQGKYKDDSDIRPDYIITTLNELHRIIYYGG